MTSNFLWSSWALVAHEFELAKLLCEDSCAVFDKFNLHSTRVTNEPELVNLLCEDRCMGSSPPALCHFFMSSIFIVYSASHMMWLLHRPEHLRERRVRGHMMCLPHLTRIFSVWEPSVKNRFQTLKRDLSGVRLGGFLRVTCELQIVNDGFKSAVILQL